MEIERETSLVLEPVNNDGIRLSEDMMTLMESLRYKTKLYTGCMNIFRGRYLVKFRNDQELEDFKANFHSLNGFFGDKLYRLLPAENVDYLQQQRLIKVLLFNAPFEMPESCIFKKLVNYGSIVKIVENTYRSNPNVKNGVRTIYFKSLQTQLPPSMFINGFRVNLKVLNAENHYNRVAYNNESNDNENSNDSLSSDTESEPDYGHIKNSENKENKNDNKQIINNTVVVDAPELSLPPTPKASYSNVVKGIKHIRNLRHKMDQDGIFSHSTKSLETSAPDNQTSDSYGEDDSDEESLSPPPSSSKERHTSTPFEEPLNNSFEEVDISEISDNIFTNKSEKKRLRESNNSSKGKKIKKSQNKSSINNSNTDLK